MAFLQKILAVQDKNKCYGCSACAQVCHHNAIVMEENSEGFLYPKIYPENCISCGACDNICPENSGALPLEVFSGRISNEEDLLKCASGGAFTALAAAFIKNNGVVIAAADSFINEKPDFIQIDKISDLYKVQGSKYFQINLTVKTYKLIRDLLKNKRNVLFCGMPCQVAAVKKVFKRFRTLFTIDIICGGVPSYKLISKYRQYKETKRHKKLINHKFRTKDKKNIYGYQSRLEYEDGYIEHYNGFDDEYTRLFSSGVLLRKSCYQCEFSNEKRMGDITIGDFWGINNISRFYSTRNKGVSLLICNSDNGLSLLHGLHDFEKERIDYSQAKQRNRPLKVKAPKRIERTFSVHLMNNLPFQLGTNLVCYRFLIKKIFKKIHSICQK